MSLLRPRRRSAPSRFVTVAFFLFVAGFHLPTTARAVSMHWKGTPVDANWSNGSNWTEGHPPSSGDDLTFPATSTILSTNNDIDGLSLVAITFSGAG